MRVVRGLTLSFFLFAASGCGDAQVSESPPHVARTSGNAVALSRDERIAVVTNRSAGVVSILSLDPKRPGRELVRKTVTRDLGAGSEPWAAIVGADDDTAYVLLRRSHEVVRIQSLRKDPKVDEVRLTVGSEPTALALSPTGQKLFVANWGEGTIDIIIPAKWGAELQTPIDLNQSLVSTQVLGDMASRPALAHPRALAITDDGDDDERDEMLYATEFFSQALPGVPEAPDFSHLDRNRQGFVYPVSLATGNPDVAIPIAPIQDTGFPDAMGTTGCFPNQLSAAAVDNDRLYVTAMCTSPRGPLGPGNDPAAPTVGNFKTLFHPAVFVIDTLTNAEIPSEGRLLTRVLTDYGENETLARMPLSPNDIAFGKAETAHTAYVAALGADAVFRLDYAASGSMLGIGSPGKRYIDSGQVHGILSGLAVSRRSSPAFAIALNDGTQQVSVIDLASEEVVPVPTIPEEQVPRALDVLTSPELRGQRFFVTGRDLWSFKGQTWSSCEGCHPGGGSDGIVWSFHRGPRRTPSTASTFDKAPDVSQRNQRLLLWGANIDEIHDVEVITRGVSGGVGGVLWTYVDEDAATSSCRLVYDGNKTLDTGKDDACGGQKTTAMLHNGLNGALGEVIHGAACDSSSPTCEGTNARDWNDIEAYIRALRAPVAPVIRDNDKGDEWRDLIDAGRDLFRQAGCAGCHGGPHWTISRRFYVPSAEYNGTIPYTQDEGTPPSYGYLRERRYQVSAELRRLNPPAAETGEAVFRDPDLTEKSYEAASQGDDQIRCALRSVGTFPKQTDGQVFEGIYPPGAPKVMEYRANLMLAQGESGYNVPSLFGMAVGAPYLHGGNARTLEEIFDEVFIEHYDALGHEILRADLTRVDEIAALVAFLLSIDETQEIEAVLGAEYDFCSNVVSTP